MCFTGLPAHLSEARKNPALQAVHLTAASSAARAGSKVLQLGGIAKNKKCVVIYYFSEFQIFVTYCDID